MAEGICYTQSGNVKKYEPGKLSISPDKVKFVDFDNHYAEPFIELVITSDHQPPGVNLEEGTALYIAGIDTTDIDLSNYLSYTPPDGYELVSEDHKNDTGVEKYHVLKNFYCEPFTVYYGTAGKTFSEFLSAGKDFYYKKKDKPIQTTYMDYPVTINIIGSKVHCFCERVTWIPGTNNGNVVLGVNIQFSGVDEGYYNINFEWEMKNGINENRVVGSTDFFYAGSGFTTTSSWQVTNSDGNIVIHRFVLNIIR